MKKKLSIAKLKKKAQTILNTWIRERDELIDGSWECISCGKIINKCQSGHYIPLKLSSSLRFNIDNCNSQCSRCNMLEGNSVGYRRGLIKKIGLKRVEDLENKAINNPNKTWNEEELNYIIKKYKL